MRRWSIAVRVVVPVLAVLALAGAIAAHAPHRAAAESSVGAIVEPSFLPSTWGYSPDPLVVSAGDTVTWVNTGSAPHTVTADDGSFDSGVITSGDSWTFTADVPGWYGFYCALHPDMRSMLIVQ